MDLFELIAVVEVPQSKKVLCQSKSCGRPVYKRVHLVKLNNEMRIFGSECYKKLYVKYPQSKAALPTYGVSTGVLLTETERNLLLNNTEQLLSKFKEEQQNEISQKTIESSKYSNKTDKELLAIALNQTKEDFRVNKGLDPDLSGWVGWVKSDAEKLFKKLKEA